MKNCVALLTALAVTAPALASVSYTGGTYLENFDTLPSATVTGAFSATIGAQSPVPGPTGWDGAKIAGTGPSASNFIADFGDSNAGGLHSHGAAGTSERALGALASGSNIMAFGLELVNNSSDTFAEVTIGLDREQWRSSTSVANTLVFAYGLSGGTITSANYLSEASMTPFSAGDLVGDAAVATNGPLPPSVVPVALTITGLTWAPGQSLFIRWTDANDTGNDAGLAVDNCQISAIVPTPGAAPLLALAGLVGLRRRR
ncbi:MAG: hypothetical protein IT438_02670 [Phycisphaerales bacterium]|nr:hypothetical protein [Phycisphaerales bacterium]